MIKKLLTLAIFILLPIFSTNAYAKPNLEITGIFLCGDDGIAQVGDATLLKSDGKFLLMDTGSSYAQKSLDSALKANGVQRLDLYISHFHGDHIENLEFVMNNYRVDKLYIPDRSYGKNAVIKFSTDKDKASKNVQVPLSLIHNYVEKLAKKTKTKIVYLKRSSTFKIGSCSAKVIAPLSTHSAFSASKVDCFNSKYYNQFSLVTMVTCGKIKYLATGDIVEEVEKRLAKKCNLKADIVKAPHHGRKGSSSKEFVTAVRARYAYTTGSKQVNSNVAKRYGKFGSFINTGGRRKSVKFVTDGRGIIVD